MTTTITQSQDLKPTPTLNVPGLRKTYAGRALKSVDFDPMSGEITVGCIALRTM
ncbi:hypothetical protein [Rhizobium ruizarguesonis]|uniref:hypothetical protein n=1 Tax=Rhizobium ruizarguesonis TaxID=2081791 RepID=UPI00144603D1|nr:hypothetical protein [Rhizobium ruizarguesonis]